MLTAEIKNDELTWRGVVEGGDIYPGYCCPGYDWEVVLTFPDDNPNYISVWGRCQNPDCPDYDGTEDDPYRGVSNIMLEDFAENLATRKARHEAVLNGIDTFFSLDSSGCTGKEPYSAFEEWAAANGYDLDDDEQRAAAVEVY